MRLIDLPLLLSLLIRTCDRARAVDHPRSSTIMRVVRTEEAGNSRCQLHIAVPRDRRLARLSILIDWACRDFRVRPTTIAELRRLNQLDDLPEGVVSTMRRNASKGLLLLDTNAAMSVVYVDDSGRLRETLIAD